jgi:hypothetical protein
MFVAAWADVDIASHTSHARDDLPTSHTKALSLAEGIPPTVVVDSGHGLHLWWALLNLTK